MDEGNKNYKPRENEKKIDLLCSNFEALQIEYNNHITIEDANHREIRHDMHTLQTEFHNFAEEFHKCKEQVAPLIENRRDWKGIFRKGSQLQGFATWWVKWPLIGYGIASLWEHIIKGARSIHDWFDKL